MNLRRPPERAYFHDIALGSPDHVCTETVPFRRTAWWKLCVGGWLLLGISVFSVSGGFRCHPMGESLSPAKYPQSPERTFLTPSGESLMWSVARWQKSIPANLMFFYHLSVSLSLCSLSLFLHQRVSLEFYIDVHAHSTMLNGFMYGNVFEDEERVQRQAVFPRLLCQNAPDFSFVSDTDRQVGSRPKLHQLRPSG